MYRISWLISVILLIALTVSAADYLTGKFFQAYNLSLPGFLVQVINTLVGFLMIGVILRIFARFFLHHRENVFEKVIQALEQISQGNFDVFLDDEKGNQISSGIYASVNKMARELGQMEQMRQEFVSNVSHEIQSPLTSIRGFAQALQNDKLSHEERRHFLEIIEMESRRLSHLAEDLLKLTALESSHEELEINSYRLDKQIREMVLLCEPQWDKKHIEMTACLDEVYIRADENLLSQVWLNLMHNAIKFSPSGGTIFIELRKYNDDIQFRIRDDGIGISPQERVHIFERFYKADKSRTHTKEGNGLGLSIVKKIVELHRGDVQVESELGKGSTFIVTIPSGNVR